MSWSLFKGFISKPLVLQPTHSRVEKKIRQSSSSQMLQRLGDMDEQDIGAHESQTGPFRWLMPYADMATLLLAMFMMLYGLGLQDNKALQLENRELASQLELQEDDLLEQEAQVEELNQRLDSLNLNLLSLESSHEALKQELTTPESQWLEQETAGSLGVDIHQDQRGVVISLNDQLVFPPASVEISASAQQALEQIAKVLVKTNQSIRVEGHTDDVPIQTADFSDNWDLSTSRAVSIVRYLVEKKSVAPERISAVGYAQYRPVADNSTIEGKQKNRRVDIVILNDSSSQSEAPAFIRKRASGVQSKAAVKVDGQKPEAASTA